MILMGILSNSPDELAIANQTKKTTE